MNVMLWYLSWTHVIRLDCQKDGKCLVRPSLLCHLARLDVTILRGSDEVLNSPRLLNLPLLLLANKQDSPTSLSVSEIRESFDAWQRAHPERQRAHQEASDTGEETDEAGQVDRKGKGKAKAVDQDEALRADGWDDGGAVEERMASLDVMGVSALEG